MLLGVHQTNSIPADATRGALDAATLEPPLDDTLSFETMPNA